MSKSSAHEPFDLAASIAPELTPLPIPQGRKLQLERGVIDRVRRSALAHRDFTTVRAEDSAWAVTSPGVLRCALSAAGGMRVELVKVAPEAPIPWPQDAHAQEVLVVDGTLVVDAEGLQPIHLSTLRQLVVGRAAAARQSAGRTGATLYVRSRTVDLEVLPAGEAQWWIAAEVAPLAAAGPACPWSSYVEGVDAAVLRAHGDVASMLIKITPGAALPDHGHSLPEDCFMLEGDMFLGDILLRAGDYQLAPVGCRHVGITSDMGGLFYFHGAVPPSASEQAR